MLGERAPVEVGQPRLPFRANERVSPELAAAASTYSCEYG